jgi:5-methylcytosine-specific restriction endonuclease McrA
MPRRIRLPVKEDTQWRGFNVPPHIKAYVFARDGHACRYCGTSGKGVILEIDHVVPNRLLGPNVAWAVVAACRPCNRSKGGHTLDCWWAGRACIHRPPYLPCL